MEILVIILSVFLALFLLIGIILAILLIKVTRQIRRVTTAAEHTVGGIEKLVGTMSKASSPLMIAKIARDQIKRVRRK